MKIINPVSGVTNVIPIFPSVVLHTITFPLNQVLELPVEDATVENLFHNIFLFAVDEFRWQRRWCMSSGDRVDRC